MIILIVVQITVEREPFTRQQSIMTSDCDGELCKWFNITWTRSHIILADLRFGKQNATYYNKNCILAVEQLQGKYSVQRSAIKLA